MASSNLNKIHPSVDALIRPIVYEMSKIDIAQQTNPIIGSHNEPEYIKEMKKGCVHITYDGNEYRLRTEKNADGDLYCRVCGRKINTKFDDSAVKTLTEAIAVINQLLLFGMLNGLRAEPIATLISLKKTLPSAAQLLAELNDYVKRDESASESERNLGLEYKTPGSFRSITTMR